MYFLLAFACLPQALFAQRYEGPLVSFKGDRKCSSLPAANGTINGAVNYGLSFTCDSLQIPSSWQQHNTAGLPQYDLAIVGGGLGGAYLVSRVTEEFRNRNLPAPKIALFERSETIGGRIMSLDGPGGLGPAVDDTSLGDHGKPLLVPEYGGMRIDPNRNPLIYNRIRYTARQRFRSEGCLAFENCTADNCCPEMLTRMDVGSIRYISVDPTAGSWLRSSKAKTSSQTYTTNQDGVPTSSYSLADIEAGIGSPFDTCIQLVVAADAYYLTGAEGVASLPKPLPPDGLFKTAMQDMCTSCTATIPGLCDLCEKFEANSTAQAVISCSGYDKDVDTVGFRHMIGLTNEVTNANLQTELFLLNVGFQKFIQSTLNGVTWTAGINAEDDPYLHSFKDRRAVVAPQFGKQLEGVQAQFAGEELSNISTAELVSEQINSSSAPPPRASDGVKLAFADGSSATTKTAYLTMLPYDLAHLEDFGDWAPEYKTVSPNAVGSVKVVFGWSNASEALPARIGLSSCTEGLCERLILDGPKETWLVRQIWLWDPSTIMLYESADEGDIFPSNTISRMAREEGMDKVVETCIDQLRLALDLPDLKAPDWARMKDWPHGSIMPGWNPGAAASDITAFVKKIRRPLGASIPLFYGNSEVTRDGDLHGWAEGALDMVEQSLPELTSLLGIIPPMAAYDPSKANLPPLPPLVPKPPIVPEISSPKTELNVGALVGAAFGGLLLGLLLAGFLMRFCMKKRAWEAMSDEESGEIQAKPITPEP